MKLISDTPSLGFLVVEDDTVAAIDLECILEDMGHTVIAVAMSSKAAAKALEKHRAKVDAVIFGATIVGLPAFPLARSLIETGCPSVVTSAHPEEVVRALGFSEPFLAKPYVRLEAGRIVRALEDQIVISAA